MMKLIALVLLFCMSTMSLSSPCSDSIYVALSQKSLNDMTGNEAAYYAQMKSQCDAQQAQELKERQEIEQARRDDARRELQAQEIKSKAGTAVFCAVLGVIILGVAVFFITKAATQNRIDKATQGLEY
jgi:hypothetical protein